MSKFKCGDIVNVKFKPDELNPYVVTGIIKIENNRFGRNWFTSNAYQVKSYKLSQTRLVDAIKSFDVGEDEIELHISEIRDNKLKELGI